MCPAFEHRSPAAARAAAQRQAAIRRRRAVAVAALVAALAVIVVATRSGGSAHAPSRVQAARPGRSATTPTRVSPRPATASHSSTTALPGPPFPVGRTQMVVSDGGRQLPTVVRYPATAAGVNGPARREGGPYPLVVFSQGFAISSEAYAGLLQQWAAAGYVVADPTYPFTSPGGPGGLDENDLVHHPADLSAVISALVRAGATPGGTLSGLIDGRRVGAAGHSDGGDVTDAVAAGTCCRDARVTAAVVLSGAELARWGGTYTASGVPLLVTQGNADPINVPACSEQIYNGAALPKYYLDLLGARHHAPYLSAGPYDAPPAQAVAYEDVVTKVTVDFWDGYLKGSAPARAAIAGDGSQAGTSTLSSGPPVPVTGSCPGAPRG